MATYTAKTGAQTFTSKGHDGFLVITGRPAGLVLQNAEESLKSAQRTLARMENNVIERAGVLAEDVLLAEVAWAKKQVRAAEKLVAEVAEVAKVQTFFWERKSLHASQFAANRAAIKLGGRTQVIKLEAAA